MPSARTRRPSASVLITSMDFPAMEICTSPGFCARPPGMFSLEGTTAITLHEGFSVAMARIAPIMAAPPHMSYFIFSMSFAGLMEIPPVSNVMAFPTRPRTGAPGSNFSGVYVMMIMRGGSALPCATESSAPIFNSAIFFSSRISTARPASRAMAAARSASMRGVRRLDGSLPSSRAKFCDSAMTRPRARPRSASAREDSSQPASAAAVISFPGFLSVLYLSESKFARIMPSTMACAAAALRSFSRGEERQLFHLARFQGAHRGPGNSSQLKQCRICSFLPAPRINRRCAASPCG